MEQRASDSEVTYGIPLTQQFHQQLTQHVTVRIKQEAPEDHSAHDAECFNETLDVCKPPSSIKNKPDQYWNSSSSSAFPNPADITLPSEEVKQELALDDHVLYKFEASFDEHDKGTEYCKHAELREHSASDVCENADTCKIKTEYNRDTRLVDDVQKCSGTKRRKNPSAKPKPKRPFVANAYSCTQCDFTTKLLASLTRHVTIKHESDAPVHRCAHCTFTTKAREYLTRHVNIEHNPNAPVYQCARCSYTTKWKQNLGRHFDDRHNEHAAMNKCPHCDYATTKSRYTLAKHCAVQHGGRFKLHKCSECDYVAKWKSSVTAHVITKHRSLAPVLGCARCSYTTRWRCELAKHVKERHEKCLEMYECSRCDFATGHRTSMRRHVKFRHDPDVEWHKCAVCDFTTKHAGYLAGHVATKHGGNVDAGKKRALKRR